MDRKASYYDPPARLGGEDVFYTGLPVEGGVYPFRTADGRWGLADAQERLVCPAAYEQITPIPALWKDHPRLLLARRGGRWGLLDGQGREALACEWDEIDYLMYSLYAVRRDGRWGFARQEGDRFVLAAEPQYATFRASETEDGVGVVFVRQLFRWGAMEHNGRGMEYERWGALDGQGRVLAGVQWPYEPGLVGSHDGSGIRWHIESASANTREGWVPLIEDDRLTAPFREGAYR